MNVLVGGNSPNILYDTAIKSRFSGFLLLFNIIRLIIEVGTTTIIIQMNKLFAVTLLLILFTACKKDEEKTIPTVSIYPLEVGNSWTYQTTSEGVFYADEEMTEIINTVFNVSENTITVIKDTILNGELHVKKIHDSFTHRNSYKAIDDDGLKDYAYDIYYSKDALKRISIVEQFKNELVNYNSHLFQSKYLNRNELVIRDYPNFELQLPLKPGAEWVFIDSLYSVFMHVVKKVIGYENVATAGRVFNCYKIQNNYYGNDFDNLKITEWVAAEGLIKTEVSFEGMALFFQDDEEHYEYIKTKSTTLLESYELN